MVDLETATVGELRAQMGAGTLTSEQLTRLSINRIAALNTRGPGLNAVRTLTPDALADAKALDAERKAGATRGPLHGIPVLISDTIDVKGLPTTAGSVALEDSVPAADAAVVARLRATAAVGKVARKAGGLRGGRRLPRVDRAQGRRKAARRAVVSASPRAAARRSL